METGIDCGARTEHAAGAPVPADLLRGEGTTIAQTRPRPAANLRRAAEGIRLDRVTPTI